MCSDSHAPSLSLLSGKVKGFAQFCPEDLLSNPRFVVSLGSIRLTVLTFILAFFGAVEIVAVFQIHAAVTIGPFLSVARQSID